VTAAGRGVRRARWSGVVLLAVSVLAACPGPAAAQPPAPGVPEPALRGTVEQIIRDYLREHPEVVVEALRAAEERRRAAERARVAETVQARRGELLEDPAAPVGGNPRGDVTIVEFFDSRCGYCRRAAPVVKQLLRDDPRVRVVYKELPILGPDSLEAARVALAAHRQGKYAPLHDALMAADAPVTRSSALAAAAALGLDVGRLEQDMGTAAIAEALQRNQELARALGVNGTPAFVIGAEVVPGFADLATLRRLVERARAR
jgi:protein-disulfide isomerase